jgi:hypothetical protein
MSQNASIVFIDADNLPSAPIQLKVGQTLAFYRHQNVGAQFLHQLIMPSSHFAPRRMHSMTLAGQPANTDLVADADAQTKGSGVITIQFSPPHPAYPPHAPVAVPFTIS